MAIISHGPMIEQDPLTDVRASAVVGLALVNARNRMAQSMELALTAGNQFDVARQVALIVIGKAAEVQPDMSVTQLLNLIETGRR